ncbi:MAG: HD domain-containing protein [Bacteroidetes bacterium]|nr:HD domain-containing protein [Bacteroidota bacterium]
MIIEHVAKGIEIAKKHRLPDLLIDFIRTHHGTSRVEYFYQSYLKNFPETLINEDEFKYPGPKPYSKETAVVMLADSVEASSRSLKNPTAVDIDELVDKIIAGKIEQEQLVNCDITFKDLTQTSKIFKKMLKSIYHVRISYPRSPQLERPAESN